MSPFEVTFIDVGHGDATLIKTPDDRFILVDCRRCPGEGIDLFKFLDDVLPESDDGRKRLDVLVITHAHDDHITGIGELYDRYEVVELWWPQHAKKIERAGNFKEFERVEEEHKAAHEGEEDDYLKWPKGSRSHWTTFSDGEVTVRCFSPPGWIEPEEELDDDEAKRLVHENCMVIKVAYKGCAVMLAGDSNKPCWERVVGYYEGRTEEETGTEVLKCQILHASHHGSRTFVKDSKDDEAYLRALELIDPELVVISVGPDSKHDHPHDDMLKIYEEQVGVENVVQTCATGTVRLEVDEDGEARLITEDGERYIDDYGWDDDDDGDADDEVDDRDGGNGTGKAIAVGAATAVAAELARQAAKRRSTPPARPAPGYEKYKQRPIERERYG
jgi:competence protein ComEC